MAVAIALCQGANLIPQSIRNSDQPDEAIFKMLIDRLVDVSGNAWRIYDFAGANEELLNKLDLYIASARQKDVCTVTDVEDVANLYNDLLTATLSSSGFERHRKDLREAQEGLVLWQRVTLVSREAQVDISNKQSLEIGNSNSLTSIRPRVSYPIPHDFSAPTEAASAELTKEMLIIAQAARAAELQLPSAPEIPSLYPALPEDLDAFTPINKPSLEIGNSNSLASIRPRVPYPIPHVFSAPTEIPSVASLKAAVAALSEATDLLVDLARLKSTELDNIAKFRELMLYIKEACTDIHLFSLLSAEQKEAIQRHIQEHQNDNFYNPSVFENTRDFCITLLKTAIKDATFKDHSSNLGSYLERISYSIEREKERNRKVEEKSLYCPKKSEASNVISVPHANTRFYFSNELLPVLKKYSARNNSHQQQLLAVKLEVQLECVIKEKYIAPEGMGQIYRDIKSDFEKVDNKKSFAPTLFASKNTLAECYKDALKTFEKNYSEKDLQPKPNNKDSIESSNAAVVKK